MSNNRVVWLSADDPDDAFPPVDKALREPDGLLAAGGDLSTTRLLCAYRCGIFPWYEDGQPLLWWSPDPRCVFLKGDFHAPRRLRRSLRKSTAEVRFNTSFGQVIEACAGPRRSEQGTWITPDMMTAFGQLHAQGWAHSIEIWNGDDLIGGLYGLAIGRAFFGESMFSHETDASKIALQVLANMLNSRQLGIVDCQVPSSHLLGLGARLIPRSEFMAILAPLCDPAKRVEKWPSAPIPITELLRK